MTQPPFSAIRAASIAFADFARPRSKYAPGTIDEPRAGYTGSQLTMARLWERGQRADLFVTVTPAMRQAAIDLINAEPRGAGSMAYTFKLMGQQLDVEFIARLAAGPRVADTGPSRVATFYRASADGLLVNPSSTKPSSQSVRVLTEGARIVEVELIGG